MSDQLARLTAMAERLERAFLNGGNGSLSEDQVALIGEACVVLNDVARKSLPSAGECSEGYPGIAHDLETMRSALTELVALKDMKEAPPKAWQIARNALKNAAPQGSAGTHRTDPAGPVADDAHAPAGAAPVASSPIGGSEAARRFMRGEITAGKLGELLGLEPGELHEFKKVCGAFDEQTSPSTEERTSDTVPLGTISECPSCDGVGKMTMLWPAQQPAPCWRCGGSGRVMAYRETDEQFKTRMEKVRAFTNACVASPFTSADSGETPRLKRELAVANENRRLQADAIRDYESEIAQLRHDLEKALANHTADLNSAPSSTAVDSREALILAQSALRRWTQLYAHLQNACGEVVSRKLDYNLPPAEHVRALEAIADALTRAPSARGGNERG